MRFTLTVHELGKNRISKCYHFVAIHDPVADTEIWLRELKGRTANGTPGQPSLFGVGWGVVISKTNNSPIFAFVPPCPMYWLVFQQLLFP